MWLTKSLKRQSTFVSKFFTLFLLIACPVFLKRVLLCNFKKKKLLLFENFQQLYKRNIYRTNIEKKMCAKYKHDKSIAR